MYTDKEHLMNTRANATRYRARLRARAARHRVGYYERDDCAGSLPACWFDTTDGASDVGDCGGSGVFV